MVVIDETARSETEKLALWSRPRYPHGADPTSSKGRTEDFESSNRGSNPRVGTNLVEVHFSRPACAFVIAAKPEVSSVLRAMAFTVARARSGRV
jgi:hypothetical protein